MNKIRKRKIKYYYKKACLEKIAAYKEEDLLRDFPGFFDRFVKDQELSFGLLQAAGTTFKKVKGLNITPEQIPEDSVMMEELRKSGQDTAKLVNSLLILMKYVRKREKDLKSFKKELVSKGLTESEIQSARDFQLTREEVLFAIQDQKNNPGHPLVQLFQDINYFNNKKLSDDDLRKKLIYDYTSIEQAIGFLPKKQIGFQALKDYYKDIKEDVISESDIIYNSKNYLVVASRSKEAAQYWEQSCVSGVDDPNKIDVNSATKEELSKKLLNDFIADKIFEARKKLGSFTSMKQIEKTVKLYAPALDFAPIKSKLTIISFGTCTAAIEKFGGRNYYDNYKNDYMVQVLTKPYSTMKIFPNISRSGKNKTYNLLTLVFERFSDRGEHFKLKTNNGASVNSENKDISYAEIALVLGNEYRDIMKKIQLYMLHESDYASSVSPVSDYEWNFFFEEEHVLRDYEWELKDSDGDKTYPSLKNAFKIVDFADNEKFHEALEGITYKIDEGSVSSESNWTHEQGYLLETTEVLKFLKTIMRSHMHGFPKFLLKENKGISSFLIKLLLTTGGELDFFSSGKDKLYPELINFAKKKLRNVAEQYLYYFKHPGHYDPPWGGDIPEDRWIESFFGNSFGTLFPDLDRELAELIVSPKALNPAIYYLEYKGKYPELERKLAESLVDDWTGTTSDPYRPWLTAIYNILLFYNKEYNIKYKDLDRKLAEEIVKSKAEDTFFNLRYNFPKKYPDLIEDLAKSIGIDIDELKSRNNILI